MPNCDGGHYYLTALVPIDNDGIVKHDAFQSSPVNMVRDALETLPTAQQSPATERIGLESLFARSPRTHLARFVVIDVPLYNGRDPVDSLVTALRGDDLLAPQPVDNLACPYLLFAADFDPNGDEPRNYLEELWTLSERELTTVFQFCYGFEKVHDAASFATFVVECQVETTMPFNDYWTTPPPFPTLPLWPLAILPIVALALGLVAGVLARSVWLGLLSGLAALAAAVYADYRRLMNAGAKPFPTAPNSSLPHVLKALYLQQAFSLFVVEQQGVAPTALQAAFQDFVYRHQPLNIDRPTQPPGVVRAKLTEAARV